VLGRRGVATVVARLELAAEFVLDGESVSGPDLIAQVVDQLEHGEGDLRAPVIWDLEEGRLVTGSAWLRHELGARR
jgi:hypothetical protein